MASSFPPSEAAEKPLCNDTFPEVAYFEVPSELSSKSTSSKNKELVKHPAFREISAVNGEINRMTLKSLRVELEKLAIDTRGTKDVLRKRLKAYERRRILGASNLEDPNTPRQHYTHLLVIDFEATCEEQQTKDYIHEIIEFPAVLLRVRDAAVVAEFHRLVRPVLNPQLTTFCRELTGIPQSGVDEAAPFPCVLQEFEEWLVAQGVDDQNHVKLAVATDGPWDMARFLLMQCSVSKLPFPAWARSWINLRKVFSNFYVTKRLCLSEMLTTLGLEFKGRPHCGLDDARNIATIAEMLVKDGASPRVNETIAHLPRLTPPTLKGSSVASVTLKEFETSERRRNRASMRHAADDAAVDGLTDAVHDVRLSSTSPAAGCHADDSSHSTTSDNGSLLEEASNSCVTDHTGASKPSHDAADPISSHCYSDIAYSDNASTTAQSGGFSSNQYESKAGELSHGASLAANSSSDYSQATYGGAKTEALNFGHSDIGTCYSSVQNTANESQHIGNNHGSTCSRNKNSDTRDCSPSDNVSSVNQENVSYHSHWGDSPYLNIERSTNGTRSRKTKTAGNTSWDSVETTNSSSSTSSLHNTVINRQNQPNAQYQQQFTITTAAAAPHSGYTTQPQNSARARNANERGSQQHRGAARSPHRGSDGAIATSRRGHKQSNARNTNRNRPSNKHNSLANGTRSVPDCIQVKANGALPSVDLSDTNEFPMLGSVKRCGR